jgi:hypothetical protein
MTITREKREVEKNVEKAKKYLEKERKKVSRNKKKYLGIYICESDII